MQSEKIGPFTFTQEGSASMEAILEDAMLVHSSPTMMLKPLSDRKRRLIHVEIESETGSRAAVSYQWEKKTNSKLAFFDAIEIHTSLMEDKPFSLSMIGLLLITDINYPRKNANSPIPPVELSVISVAFTNLVYNCMNPENWVTKAERFELVDEFANNLAPGLSKTEFKKQMLDEEFQFYFWFQFGVLEVENVIDAAFEFGYMIRTIGFLETDWIWYWLVDNAHSIQNAHLHFEDVGDDGHVKHFQYEMSSSHEATISIASNFIRLQKPKSVLSLPWDNNIRVQLPYGDHAPFFFLLCDSMSRGSVLDSNFLKFLCLSDRLDLRWHAFGLPDDIRKTLQFHNERDGADDIVRTAATSLPDAEAGVSDVDRRYAIHQIQSAIRQADESGRSPLIGCFILDEDLYVDQFLKIGVKLDHLRVVILSDGLWVTVVFDEYLDVPVIDTHRMFVSGYWTPLDNDNFHLTMPGNLAYMMRIIASGLWRDACIVREGTFVFLDGAYSDDKSSVVKKRLPSVDRNRRTVYLPRKIYKVRWGSDIDRAKILDIADASSGKRGHYRTWHIRPLPDGHKASDEAREKANNLDVFLPDEGYTFVSESYPNASKMPETEADNSPRIVAKGLQMTLQTLTGLKLQE